MMSKNQKKAFEGKREDEIKGFGNVDIITKLWDSKVDKLSLWNVDIITKLWDKKINELWMNFGTKHE